MRLGVLGIGNMGFAILKSLANSKQFNKRDLMAFDVRAEPMQWVSKTLGVACARSELDLVQKCSCVILACKPKDIPIVCTSVAPLLTKDHLVISIAAGIPLQVYYHLFLQVRVIRVMPSIPLLVNEGMTVYCAGTRVTVKDKQLIEKIFGLTGKVLEISEDKMDISAIAFSCMPGWSAYFMDAFIQACKQQGLTEDQAELMIAQAFLGSGKYVLETKTQPVELVKKVASPGGITERGLQVMDETHVKEIIDKVVSESLKRTNELSQQAKQN